MIQAANGIENLKMGESPAKKLTFDVLDKENIKDAVVTVEDAPVEIKKSVEETPVEKAAVAPTIKPDESDEPLLQENPHRFVLFPIKYHEVGDTSSRAHTRSDA